MEGTAMSVGETLTAFGISLGLGLLVGIQRESVSAPLAGVRTFALITVFGTLTGILSATLGAWVVVAGLLGVVTVAATGNLLAPKPEHRESGITTEIAILLMFAIGAAVVLVGERSVAVVLGAGVAVLLYSKPVTHRFVERLGQADMRAMMQFALISLVILPVLPERTYGPYGVLNPREIWWMVVLVVGISLAGYIALKLKGEGAGVLLAGAIGGLVSSTATTVSFARRGARSGREVAASSLVILLASTVVFARLLFELSVVAPSVARRAGIPIAVWLVASVALAALVWRRSLADPVALPEPKNPAELRPALMFGLVFAVVLLAVAAARQSLGDRGIYIAAALSGLTDVDAITLSTARLAEDGSLEPAVVWRSIVIAVMANLVFKAGVVWTLAGRDLARRVALQLGILAAIGGALLAFWPR